jgi:NTE family protein
MVRSRMWDRSVAALAVALATGWLAVGAARAQGQVAQSVQTSPRIGLVLSGGGARGAAHVGVLKVLEEYGIPVHAVAGTSMGAIVGGMYAAGWTPVEIEAEMAAIDWPAMLTDRLPRDYLSFRRREEDREFLTQFELPVDGRGARLPAGVIAGHNVEARLARLFLPAAAIRDFDELVVPFRAVATDLETGMPVVLGGGDLALAVRASLSMPAVFAPVQLGGRLLVDGGVARNLPVDVAREMGVDVLVVVDAGTPLSEREALRSLLDVSKQLTHIMTETNTAVQRESLEETDVLIRPELGSVNVLDFHRWAEAVDAGEAAARAMEAALRNHALAPDAYTRTVAAQRRRFRGPVIVDSVDVVATSGVSAVALRSLVKVRPGGRIDPAVLEADLLRLHGLRLFQRIHARIEVTGDTATLVFEPEPRARGNNSLRFGLGLEEDHGAGTARFSFLTSLWLRQLNRAGGELRFDLQVGEPRRALLEFFQPVREGSPLFIATQAVHLEGDAVVTLGPETTPAPYRTTQDRLSVEMGLHLGGRAEVRAGVLKGRRSAKPRDDGRDLPAFHDAEGGVTATITLDHLDDAALPHRGGLARLSWVGYRAGLGGATSYDDVEARVAHAVPVGRHTVILGVEAGTRSAGAPPHDTYSLGGVFRLTGRAPGSLAGRHGGLLRVIYLHELGDGGRVYVGASAEAGGTWDGGEDIQLADLVPAGSVLLGVRTLIGPVYLVLGHAEGGSPTGYLSVGRRVASPW